MKKWFINVLFLLAALVAVQPAAMAVDDASNWTAVSLLVSDSRTATANGSAVDVRDYNGRVKIVLDSEAGSGTSPTNDVKIQDSDDGSTGWADVSGATFTQVTDGGAAYESIHLDIGSTKRYIRAVSTVTGTSPVFVFGVQMFASKQYN